VASGTVVQGVLTVNWVAVLRVTVRTWPAPAPPVTSTVRPTHCNGTQLWVVSFRVVSVLPPLDVPRWPAGMGRIA
jgi:hypothetical protein